jgi:hypothetical protein
MLDKEQTIQTVIDRTAPPQCKRSIASNGVRGRFRQKLAANSQFGVRIVFSVLYQFMPIFLAPTSFG